MSLSQSVLEAAAAYERASFAYSSGELETCVSVAEAALAALAEAEEREGFGEPPGGAGDAAATEEEVEEEIDNEAEGHLCFARLLALLACAQAALGGWLEGERLLASAEGYVLEHLPTRAAVASAAEDSNRNDADSSADTSPSERGRRDVQRRGGQRERQGRLARLRRQQRQRRLALAHLAYSRAVLLVEYALPAAGVTAPGPAPPRQQQRQQQGEGVRRAAEALLAEAERHLSPESGPQRLLLADVWHTRGVCAQLSLPATVSSSPPSGAPRTGAVHAALGWYRRSLELRCRFDDGGGVCRLRLALTLEHVAHLLRRASGGVGGGGGSGGGISGAAAAVTGAAHTAAAAAAFPLSGPHEALAMLSVVCDTRLRLLGARHPLTRAAQLASAVTAADCGRPRAAVVLLRELLQDAGQTQQQQEEGGRNDQGETDAVTLQASQWLRYLTAKHHHGGHSHSHSPRPRHERQRHNQQPPPPRDEMFTGSEEDAMDRL